MILFLIPFKYNRLGIDTEGIGTKVDGSYVDLYIRQLPGTNKVLLDIYEDNNPLMLSRIPTTYEDLLGSVYTARGFKGSFGFQYTDEFVHNKEFDSKRLGIDLFLYYIEYEEGDDNEN